jgi:hypothetical protein
MHPVARTRPSLFDSYVENYDAACDCGLRYVGETCAYFAQRRVAYTGRRGFGRRPPHHGLRLRTRARHATFARSVSKSHGSQNR